MGRRLGSSEVFKSTPLVQWSFVVWITTSRPSVDPSLSLSLSLSSLSLAFASNTRKVMEISKIQITRFTSTLILFMFTGTVFFNSVNATKIPGHHSQCNTGPVQCCQQSFDSNSHEGKNLLALNDIGLDVLSGATGMIGVKCTPITALGAGSGGNW